MASTPSTRRIVCLSLAAALFTASGALAALATTGARGVPRQVALAKVASVAAPPFVPRADLKVKPLPVPTPLLASYGVVDVHLPVKPAQLTVIAFHQAGSRPSAVDMRPLVPIVKSTQLTTDRPRPSVEVSEDAAEVASAEGREEETVYQGRALRLWRSGRSGDPDTAVDVGTKPGLPVLAPVTGTVAAVHRYRLYGKYDDYEIHMLPATSNKIDCVVLHVTDPRVKVGDSVVGGVTPIARVRWISRLFASQLDEYTHDGGNHVHVQLDRLPRPGVVQLMGGVQAEFDQPKR